MNLVKILRFFGGEAKAARAEETLLAGSREVLQTNKAYRHSGAIAEMANRNSGPIAEIDRDKIISFFLVLVSLSLLAFLGFVIARRNNRRMRNYGHTEGEQPAEERQLLIGNAAVAEENPGIQQIGFEIEENRTITHHHDQPHCKDDRFNILFAACNFGTSLAFINFILEIPSAVFDQLENSVSEKEKSLYLLISMLLSLTLMLVCLVELVYKCRKEKIIWRWSNERRMPWFYYPTPAINRPFGTFVEIIGWVCVVFQCIVSTVNYGLSHRHHAATIQFPVMPTIFSFGLLCSRLMATEPNEELGGESRTSDQDGGYVALDQANLEPLTPAEMQQDGAELLPSSNL